MSCYLIRKLRRSIVITRNYASLWLGSLAAVAITMAFSGDLYAGGFASARFGGANGTVTDTNPSALYYNPAATAFSPPGTQILVDLTLAFRNVDYIRPKSQVSPYKAGDPFAPGAPREKDRKLAFDANVGTSHLFNTIALPMVGISSDFGLNLPFRVGAAFYIPFGGSSVWGHADNAEALEKAFPGSGDGPVRWYSIDGTIQTFATSVGVSYLIEPIRLSLGLTGNLYYSRIDTLRARNSDGTDNLTDAQGNLKEGRSLLKVSSLDYGMGVGLMAEVLKDYLWIGASWQSRPNFTGKMSYTGDLTNLLAQAPAPKKQTKVFLSSTLPDIFRFGVKSKLSQSFTLKAEFEWERWSAFQSQCLLSLDGRDTIDSDTIKRLCKTHPDGSPDTLANSSDPEVIQILKREWEDTYKVRLDASWALLDWLVPTFGVSYDSNAIPDSTLDPAILDMNKVTISAGSLFPLHSWFELGVDLTDVIYFSRNTTKNASNQSLVGVSRQPGNGGYYAQNTFLVTTSAQFSF